jgi:hypothetical protein
LFKAIFPPNALEQKALIVSLFCLVLGVPKTTTLDKRDYSDLQNLVMNADIHAEGYIYC